MSEARTEAASTSSVPSAYRERTDDDNLARGVKWSLIAHILFGASVLIKGLVFPGNAIPFIPTLKVDLVGLPDVLKKDLKSPNNKQFQQEISKLLKEAEKKAKPVPVPEAKKTPETKKTKEAAPTKKMALKPDPSGTEKIVEKKNKRALDRIKAFAKIQDVSDSEESTPAKKTPVAPPIKGNKLSGGTSLSGEAKEAAEASYLELLRDQLQENWTLPAWLSRQKLQALVQIYIDSKGRLRGLKFLKSSGNTQFDDSVKRAIQESQPFPIPPSDLESSLLGDGISVGFPL